MTKKQSWIKKESNKTLIKIFIGFVVVFGFISLMWWVNPTSYICSKNPEKCVCEEYGHGKWHKELCELQNDGCNKMEKQYPCTKSRLKTPTELQSEADIKSCQDNPREDDKCKCENTRTSFICGGNPTPATKYFKSEIEITNYYNTKEEELGECHIFPSNKEYMINNSDKVSFISEEQKDLLDQFSIKYNILNIRIWDNYAPQKIIQKSCLKSLPKTECEKGNLDYELQSHFISNCSVIISFDDNITNQVCSTETQTICRKK